MSEESNSSEKKSLEMASQAPDGSAEAPMGETARKLKDAGLLFQSLSDDATGNEVLRVDAEYLIRVATFLRDTCQFDLLMSCSGVDRKDHLESIYHLYSTKTHRYIAIIVEAKNEHSPSLVSVWNAADWHERESYDLFGIQYDGHPNLTRILLPADWVGYPLRKDYKQNDPRLVWNER